MTKRTQTTLSLLLVVIFMVGVYVTHWPVTIFIVVMIIISIIGQVSLWLQKKKKNNN